MTHNYKIWLWPGAGYCLGGPWEIEATCEEHVLELLVVKLIANECWDYMLTQEDYDKLCAWCGYNPDEHFGDDMEGWHYIDATMEGAPYPVYLRTMEMRIEEVELNSCAL